MTLDSVIPLCSLVKVTFLLFGLVSIVEYDLFQSSDVFLITGDLLIDEDVDIIGGNDPPVSSHPPHKIEKDDACRNNECSSSSSSSRESGSSSSGSCLCEPSFISLD